MIFKKTDCERRIKELEILCLTYWHDILKRDVEITSLENKVEELAGKISYTSVENIRLKKDCVFLEEVAKEMEGDIKSLVKVINSVRRAVRE